MDEFDRDYVRLPRECMSIVCAALLRAEGGDHVTTDGNWGNLTGREDTDEDDENAYLNGTTWGKMRDESRRGDEPPHPPPPEERGKR